MEVINKLTVEQIIKDESLGISNLVVTKYSNKIALGFNGLNIVVNPYELRQAIAILMDSNPTNSTCIGSGMVNLTH